jgi:hypothetical protein
MEKKFLKHPGDVLYSISLKMQKWGVLLKPAKRDRFDKLRKVMETWMKEFLKSRHGKETLDDFSL